jgi:hypothetical protein
MRKKILEVIQKDGGMIFKYPILTGLQLCDDLIKYRDAIWW